MNKIYPIWFYGRTKGNSDLKFILSRLSVIPDKYKRRVCDKYEKIYQKKEIGYRRNANTYLHKVAIRFRYLKKT